MEKERTPPGGLQKNLEERQRRLSHNQVGSPYQAVGKHDNVIKEIAYDPFGGIIEGTNPGFRIPLGFACGLHDRDLGFVRFGWRDKSAGQRIWH
ncbi:MAG: hypothetical protein AB7E51_00425 [Pseudodesulfovibrio sp.]|uniref:hypothetical protein n=1 Tax=Pseudodesulfovibrio sp. TaxID=2035812 RepID=UPI003D0B3AA0